MILLLFCCEMHMADKLLVAASENNMPICASVRLSKTCPLNYRDDRKPMKQSDFSQMGVC